MGTEASHRQDVGGVLVLSMAVPVIYPHSGHGYTHSLYWRVIVWALACTVSTLWFMRASFTHTWNTDPHSVIGKLARCSAGNKSEATGTRKALVADMAR